MSLIRDVLKCQQWKKSRDVPSKNEMSGNMFMSLCVVQYYPLFLEPQANTFFVLTNKNNKEYLGNAMKNRCLEKKQHQFHAGLHDCAYTVYVYPSCPY